MAAKKKSQKQAGTLELMVVLDKYTSSNVNKVPLRQWRKWSNTGRMLFNYLYSVMHNNQNLFKHPATQPLTAPLEWKTTAWNAAWEAADFVSKETK